MQAVVNEEFVRRFIKNGEAIGRRIQSRDRTYIIAGVARNAVYESFGEKTSPMLYLSYRDRPLVYRRNPSANPAGRRDAAGL